MPKISATIVCLNEEDKIEDCLKSLQPVVDEIIVVDSLSTDGTLEIARRYTDKIYEQEWLGFIDQKNLAASKATHDWILNVDCDERLDPELTDALRDIKDELDDSCVYRMSRKTFYVYRWLKHTWYPDRTVRLFNRRKTRHGGVSPHDRIITDDLIVKDLPGDILHYSYDNLSQHMQIVDKYTDTAAQQIIDSGKRVSLFTPFTHAAWAFLRMYVVRGGFLDGFAGFTACYLSMVYTYLKYSKVIFHRRQRAN